MAAADRPQTALVTGASTGIGRELSRLLARKGHSLALVARTRDPLEVLADELRQSHGVTVHVIDLDLSLPTAGETLFASIQSRDIEVDILVNNAGIGLYGEFVVADMDATRRLIQLNVTTPVELTRLFLPAMIQRGKGRILNVASTAAFVPGPLMAAYYASKAFLVSFSEAVADEIRASNVTLSVVCPGPTDTEFQHRAGMQRSKLFQGFMMDAETVAVSAYEGMMRGKILIVPGLRNKMVPLLAKIVPRALVTVVSRRAAEQKRSATR